MSGQPRYVITVFSVPTVSEGTERPPGRMGEENRTAVRSNAGVDN